jgi:hypothetical protein
MESNQEARARVKEARRAPQEEKVGLGTRLKKRLSKKQRGEFKIRVTNSLHRKGLEPPNVYIFNQYRDEDAAKGAMRTLGRKYSFYLLEVLDPEGNVIMDNKEEYEARKARDKQLRSADVAQ